MQDESNVLDVIHAVLHPGSIAVIGASNDPTKNGYRMVKFIVENGFPGQLYPINPKEEQVYGLRAYPSIEKTPGPVDYAIIILGSERVPQAIRECVRKRVKAAHIFSAGFAESGEEGRRLQNEMVAMAREGGVRLIGPNCMGIYSSTGKVNCFHCPAPPPGGVAFAAQSGMFTYDFLRQGTLMGMGISRAISFGTGSDLEGADFLEYLGADPETRVIGMYLEGMRDGRRFFEVARRTSREKPVLVLKGGRTRQGVEAALSHTGTLAGDYSVWTSAMRQAGAIDVDNFQALMEAALVLDCLKLPAGRRVALIGQGGGASVVATDLCLSLGLEVPEFHPDTIARLKQLPLPPGMSLENPMDPTSRALSAGGGTGIKGILEAVREDPNIDAMVVHFNFSTYMAQMIPEQASLIARNTIDSVIKAATPRVPTILVVRGCGELEIEALKAEAQASCREHRIPVLGSLESALRAMAVLVRRQENLRNN